MAFPLSPFLRGEAVFTSWMNILTQVPDGVLWLLGGAEDTNARLRNIAKQSGISPERLIFATKKPIPSTWLAMRSLTCSWIHFLMARTRPPPTRCGWADRS